MAPATQPQMALLAAHPTIAEEHRQIMELALARDTAACKVLKQHFEHAAQVIGSMMAEATKAAAPAKKSKASAKAKPKSAKAATSRVA